MVLLAADKVDYGASLDDILKIKDNESSKKDDLIEITLNEYSFQI